MRALRSRQSLERSIEGLPAHAAVLDGSGSIIAVNEAWRRFGCDNGLRVTNSGIGTSYLRACEASEARATEGPVVARAIRRILNGAEETFRKGYSCHGPEQARWFRVEVASLRSRGWSGALVTHAAIDEAAIRQEIADAERSHIARELHDTTAQNLTAALLDLERVARTQRETFGVTSEDLDEAISLCARSLGEVRCLAYELSPPGFRTGRLVESLKRLANTFARRTGFAVMLLAAPLTPDDDDLSRESSAALYRAAEESLYNARRHSGGHSVSVRLHRGKDDLRLEVADDGRGITSDALPGKGLCDVRERLESCGGSMEIVTRPGGTVFVASVPAGGGEDADDRHRG
jgi:signal transduction histidine kinase